MALSYDLHVHPGPSAVPRWGNGEAVWDAARAAGVRGFVWKSHEEHTSGRCAQLPEHPVRAIGSASLNPWARMPDITAAIEAGAEWVWGPTTSRAGEIAWDLPLPEHWDGLAAWLRACRPRVVLATGHLGSTGRAAMVRLAAEVGVPCSVTHTLLIGLDEALELARLGAALEIDAYTYLHPPSGRALTDVAKRFPSSSAAAPSSTSRRTAAKPPRVTRWSSGLRSWRCFLSG
jgi:hypothetical protein